MDSEVVVREATEPDGPALAELDRITPIVRGNLRVTFDRSDYFADARLMEHALVALAEVEGVVVAVNWGAWHRAVIGGVERHATTAMHTRVHPQYQRRGLWGTVSKKFFEHFQQYPAEAIYAFVHRDNEVMQRSFSRMYNKWSFPVCRALIQCADVAGPPVGRAATPSDAPYVVELLNDTHAGEEMFLPYSVGSLRARLERAPDLYSWDKVWIEGGAVVGVRPTGPRVISEKSEQRSESVRAFVLDYGVLPGAEPSFEVLLRAWCGWLTDHGTTELALFTWEGARSYAVASALGEPLEALDLFMLGLSEPKGAGKGGLYVDQIYI